jgi:acetolactate synthase-1/2/3 large subunit
LEQTQNNTVTVADFLSDFLEEKKISKVFQLSGGMITQLIDSISQKNKIQVFSLFHEQSCAFAISAIGRITKKPSVAFATSGPGATNLITGIGDCYFDSIPAIFITGQVNTFELKGNREIRQLGFQETNIVEMVKPITKMAVQLNEDDDIISILNELYQASISGRPGPVLLDIPMNVQRLKINLTERGAVTKEPKDKVDLKDVVELISNSKRPLIWAGNGIHLADSENSFRDFVEKTKIPCVLTLHGIDLLSSKSKMRVGMIGSYGNRWANKCVAESDLIIFLGSRIDIRQTGANLSLFQDKKIIRIDNDKSELTNRISHGCLLEMELTDFFIEIDEQLKSIDFDFNNWIEEIEKLKIAHPIKNETILLESELGPYELIETISEKINNRVTYTVDVGSHQMWAAQSLKFKVGDRFLTSGGMGSMGFSIPAAIGTRVLDNDSDVIVIVGDGSFQMNIQELQFISNSKLNIKILVVNNESLGMIRQFQDSYMEGRYFGTKWGYSVPNICAVSRAYGIESMTLTGKSELESRIDWFLSGLGPKLLEFKLRSDLDVFPKIAFGQTMDKMEPEFIPLGMEST